MAVLTFSSPDWFLYFFRMFSLEVTAQVVLFEYSHVFVASYKHAALPPTSPKKYLAVHDIL